jgi:hypothetical protein
MVAGALLAVVAGCSDGTGPGRFGGTLSFNHSGATSGTFSASGSLLEGDPQTTNWVAGVRDEVAEAIAIAARVARPGEVDDIVIDFPQVGPGTVTIANGAGIIVAFGQTESGDVEWSCTLTSGSVTVASVTNERARGTFSGSGSCVSETGASAAFTVTNGTFDAPLVDVDAL